MLRVDNTHNDNSERQRRAKDQAASQTIKPITKINGERRHASDNAGHEHQENQPAIVGNGASVQEELAGERIGMFGIDACRRVEQGRQKWQVLPGAIRLLSAIGEKKEVEDSGCD